LKNRWRKERLSARDPSDRLSSPNGVRHESRRRRSASGDPRRGSRGSGQRRGGTGSTLCVFQHEIAERLGIKVEDGIEDYISAMGTILKVYGHDVMLVLDELSMDLIVYFPAYQQIPRNLLGRQGFLQRILFGLDDYEGVVYFGYHGDQ
jgi:hypothetical protein